MDEETYQCPACAGEMSLMTDQEKEARYETTMFNSPTTHLMHCDSCGNDWQFVTKWRTPPWGMTTLGEEIADFTRRRLERIVGEL